jgi:hypothetical protein
MVPDYGDQGFREAASLSDYNDQFPGRPEDGSRLCSYGLRFPAIDSDTKTTFDLAPTESPRLFLATLIFCRRQNHFVGKQGHFVCIQRRFVCKQKHFVCKQRHFACIQSHFVCRQSYFVCRQNCFACRQNHFVYIQRGFVWKQYYFFSVKVMENVSWYLK